MMVTKAKPHGVGRQTAKNPMVVEGMAGGGSKMKIAVTANLSQNRSICKEKEREKERISKLILTAGILTLNLFLTIT